jgi:hypothetical protein
VPQRIVLAVARFLFIDNRPSDILFAAISVLIVGEKPAPSRHG